jgi:orotidine-5'-phosphate decarboxylase
MEFTCSGRVNYASGKVLRKGTNTMQQPGQQIICAIDVDTADRAVKLVESLAGHVGVFKVGLELIMAEGIGVVDRLRDAGAERIFFDAKLHDIPNTVAGAMRGIVRLGAWCVTVHAAGGSAMMQAAAQVAKCEGEASNQSRPLVLGVTVLTSISSDVLASELHVKTALPDYVPHLALSAQAAGCDGVIASPQEIELIRAQIPDPDFLVITPGVRPAGSAAGDQARVLTPSEAIRRGANYLVIGRPITAAPDPIDAAKRIADEIANAR